ncbi:MAG: hypothetical protein ABII22_02510 [Candidatus Micrarchaeota archaeon]
MKKILTLLVIFLLLGCVQQQQNIGKNETTSLENQSNITNSSVTNIDISKFNGSITFEIEELNNSYGNISPFLHVQTNETYPCSNNYFSHRIETNGSTIHVVLLDVMLEKVCIEIITNSSFFEQISLKDGNYTLEFVSAKGTDSYQLIVDANKVSVLPIKSTFSKFE